METHLRVRPRARQTVRPTARWHCMPTSAISVPPPSRGRSRAPQRGGRVRQSSWCRNTPRAASTSISAWRPGACCGRGRCPRARAPTRPSSAWRCAPKITRWRMPTSKAASRPAITVRAWSRSGTAAPGAWSARAIRRWPCAPASWLSSCTASSCKAPGNWCAPSRARARVPASKTGCCSRRRSRRWWRCSRNWRCWRRPVTQRWPHWTRRPGCWRPSSTATACSATCTPAGPGCSPATATTGAPRCRHWPRRSKRCRLAQRGSTARW